MEFPTEQNAYVERFNRTVLYDWRAYTLFESITEVQDFASAWLWHYKNERPVIALDNTTPIMKLAMAV